MDDLLSISEDFRARRRRRFIYGVLIIYFVALFVYTINISQQRMPFYTQLVGYDSYQTDSQLTMRVFVIGTLEQLPLSNIQADLTLLRPGEDGGWKLFSGSSGAETYIDIMVPLPKLTPGNYLVRLVTSHSEYGSESNDIRISITEQRPPRMVDIVRVDPKYMQKAPPIKLHKLSKPMEITLIPNTGRFVPSVNNSIMLVAETLPERLPVADLKVGVATQGKTIANLTTDEMGHAVFSYYPHQVGGEKLDLTFTEKDGKSETSVGELRPMGAQIVTRPQQFMLPVGAPLRFKLETLSEGVYNIDLISYGNWILTQRQEMRKAAALIDLQVPNNIKGAVQVQIARGTSSPHLAYSVFNVWFYDPKTAVIDETDERLKNTEPDDKILARMKLEKPFAALWNYIDKSPGLGESVVESWQKKLNSMGLKQLPYDPQAAAEEILREVDKDFILLPQLVDTYESRQTTFAAAQKAKRDNALILLAISGLIVAGLVAFRIWREMQTRDTDVEGIEKGGKHVAGLVALLVIIVLAYVAMLYLMSMLDWWKGI